MIARSKLDAKKHSLLLALGFLFFSINSWAQTPTIIAHPADQKACENSGTTFGITANGVTTYQWEVNDGTGWTTLSNAGQYSGTNTATLGIMNLSIAQAGYNYRCVLTDAGTNSINSNMATLTVYEVPNITNNPSNSRICLNDNTSFSIAAVGKDISYQWQVDDGSGWTDISNTGVYSNATTNTLSITTATATLNNNKYRCVVSGKCAPVAQSSSAVLNIDLPPTITTQPSDKTTCENAGTSFSIAATGTTLSYQWQEDNGTGYKNIINNSTYSGATTNKLNITANGTLNGYQYRCVVTGKCNPSETSNDATLTINYLPVVTKQPAHSTICEGENTQFHVAATGTNPTYQWQVDNGTGSFSNLSNNTIYSDVTTSVLKLKNPPTSYNGNKYRCIVSGTCSPDGVSSYGQLEILLTTQVLTNIAADTFCEGKLSTVMINSNGAGLKYQWQRNDGTGFKDIVNNATYSGEKTNMLAINNTPKSLQGQYIRCIVNGTCKSDTTENIKANILYKPEVVSSPTNVAVIQGQNASFEAEGKGTGIYYQWQASADGSNYSNINNNAIYSGTQTTKLTVSNVSMGQDGFLFRCMIKGLPSCSFTGAPTSAATLNVAPPLSVSNLNANNKVALYPNPATGNEITLTTSLTEPVDFIVINNMGKTVYKGQLNKQTTLETNNMTSGIYTVIFKSQVISLQPIRFTKL
ncbi:MAG: T9SS type A sorting domain-containing protein [Flavipsychrobacter sp.]